jgi:HEAT repeat protein
VIPPLEPTFEAALRDVHADNPRFRMAAATRLGEPPSDQRDRALEALLALANDPVGAVREAAYEAIGEIAPEQVLPRLLAAFDDAHLGARQAAVLSAGRVAPERSKIAIERLLDDPRPEMRFSAIWTLSRIGLLDANRLASALRDGDDEVRLLALECLGELGATNRQDEIAELLEDHSDQVRFTAAKALAALGDPRGAPTLRAALHDASRAFDAAIGLGDLQDRQSSDALRSLARRRFRSPIVRAAAARALVKLDDPVGVDVIRKIVRSWRIEARQYAVELIGELGLVALLPDFRRAFERSARIEQPVYETALERLAPKSSEAQALLASLRGAHHAP